MRFSLQCRVPLLPCFSLNSASVEEKDGDELYTVQVMAAPPEKREELLADLQKFAFMGIPDIRRTQPGQVNRLIVARNRTAEWSSV
jgi:hypothetical protein